MLIPVNALGRGLRMRGAYSFSAEQGTRSTCFWSSRLRVYLPTQKGRPGQPFDWPRPALLCALTHCAEGKRFELLVRGYRTLVFKTSSFGRSDNLP